MLTTETATIWRYQAEKEITSLTFTVTDKAIFYLLFLKLNTSLGLGLFICEHFSYLQENCHTELTFLTMSIWYFIQSLYTTLLCHNRWKSTLSSLIRLVVMCKDMTTSGFKVYIRLELAHYNQMGNFGARFEYCINTLKFWKTTWKQKKCELNIYIYTRNCILSS